MSAEGDSFKDPCIRDLGPPTRIEVPSPVTIWKTTQTPVSVSLPLILKSSNPLGKYQLVGFIVFLVLIAATSAFAAWDLFVAGEPNTTLRLKGMNLLMHCLAIVPLLGGMFYSAVRKSISREGPLVIGVDGLLDKRIPAKPVKWQDIEEIKPIYRKGAETDVRLKLRKPCSFREECRRSSAKFLGVERLDDRDIYIAMRLKHEGKKFDPALLLEIMKERKAAAQREDAAHACGDVAGG